MTDALAAIRALTDIEPRVALILGSGLGALADAADDAVVIETRDIPGYPSSTVEGHKGRVILGTLEGVPVVFVQGRLHRYEGHSLDAVTFPIRLVQALGARDLIVTNAAGGINRSFPPGTLMFIEDHINAAFQNPLAGSELYGGPRFLDMSEPYDLEWMREAEQVALDLGIATRQGVYAWVLGPSYETKAEVRMLGRFGADAVGMSTVPEVLMARQRGMNVLGISTITNPAAGLSAAPLDHGEVLEVGRQVRADLERLVRGIVAKRA